MADTQLKYFQMKTMRFKVPNIKRGPDENKEVKRCEQTRMQSHVHKYIFKTVHREMALSVHKTFSLNLACKAMSLNCVFISIIDN